MLFFVARVEFAVPGHASIEIFTFGAAEGVTTDQVVAEIQDRLADLPAPRLAGDLRPMRRLVDCTPATVATGDVLPLKAEPAAPAAPASSADVAPAEDAGSVAGVAPATADAPA